MFARIEVKVPTEVFTAISEAERNAPRLMAVSYERAVRRLRVRIVETLATPPGAPHYPIQWQTPRQRRAFFATNGFGRGIPAVRTGELSQGWQTDLRTADEGGIFTVFNKVPYMRFVQGIQVQTMHLDTGWVQEADVIRQFQQEAKDILIETWRTVADPFAGVPQENGE